MRETLLDWLAMLVGLFIILLPLGLFIAGAVIVVHLLGIFLP